MKTRAQRIADELLHHGTRAGGTCSCGHHYHPGESIAHHRGTAVDTALTLHDAGVTDTDVHEATTTALRLALAL